jgi:hypothetical protein
MQANLLFCGVVGSGHDNIGIMAIGTDTNIANRVCLQHGPAAQDIVEERDIGTDATEGRFAE